MTLNSNAAKWLKISLLIAVPIAFVISWLWLSGYLFLQMTHIETEPNLMTVYQYWYYYHTDKRTMSWLVISGLISFLIVSSPALLALRPDSRKLFGEARWANMSEIRKAGLCAKKGIIVGVMSSFFGLRMQYLIFSGAQHVMMAAPTRSGKGVSVVVPNLLSWPDSLVVLDIKKENWDITSGYRHAHGQECYLLNLAPRDLKSHRWNPLFYISSDPNFRINDIQKIGQMLFPKIENEAPIWQSSARSLWLGVILYLIESDDLPVTMGEALRQITMGDERLAEIVESRQSSDNPLSDECYLALKEYLDTPDKTRGSVRKGFTSSLELFYNPVIDAVTADNDFDLRDIRKRKMSIYISITPDDLDRLAPLINLFFQQLIDLNTRELPEQNPELKYQVLVMPDEFTAMGRVAILSKGISYIAGYGLRMLPIIQSPAQLRETYGADAAETFIENHALQIIFAPKSARVAKDISESLGVDTVKNKSKSRQLTGRSGRSENVSETGRALLLPQEVRDIGAKSEIILLENCKPIKCKKITWYKDSIFSERGNGQDGIIKWPSPIIPQVDPSSRVKGKVDFISNSIKSTSEAVTRAVTIDDIDNIDDLSLDDFSCDFSKIEIPSGNISDDEMSNLVTAFFSELPNN